MYIRYLPVNLCVRLLQRTGQEQSFKREKNQIFSGVWYIIIDCATSESIVETLQVWICGFDVENTVWEYIFYFYGSLKKTSIYNIVPEALVYNTKRDMKIKLKTKELL